MGKSKAPRANAVVRDAPAKPASHVRSPGVQKKPSKPQRQSVPENTKNFIDDLFTKAKHKSGSGNKTASAPESKPKGHTSTAPNHKPVKGGQGKKDDLFGLVEEARKKTDEGWNVYSEAELKLDKKGGDTPLCPFDCECCY